MAWDPITKQNLVEQHKKLVEAVYAYDYYVAAFEYVKDSFDLELNSPEQICTFWNNFWYALPDNPGIHRDPFERICEMAEGAYIQCTILVNCVIILVLDKE